MYQELLKKNLDGCSVFVVAIATHQGILNTHRLHKVAVNPTGIEVVLGTNEEKKNDFSIGMGGEVANSFCTLYEAAYFFQALFLSAVGTVAIRRGLLEKITGVEEETARLKITERELLLFTNDEIIHAMEEPDIAIVSSLDTDTEPVRYNKHDLWQLSDEALTMRVDNIDSNGYNQRPIDRSGEGIYWVWQDVDIAHRAMTNGGPLTYVKALQLYQAFSIICVQLGIDIRNIPLYFNFVPRQEIIENGKSNSYLKVLETLHSRSGRDAYKSRTGISKPWMIGVSCPQCGISSKRAVSYVLLADNRTVKCSCRNTGHSYRNERGDMVWVRGCGHKWTFTVPESEKELWHFIRDNDITLHFATRWLICLLKDTVDTPIGYVLTDMGIIRDERGFLRVNPRDINGYGDHRRMLTSALELQDWLLTEDIPSLRGLKKSGVLVQRPLYLFGYDHPMVLVDDALATYEDETVFVSDTSFLKALDSGVSIEELFMKSVRLCPFTVETLRIIKNNKLGTMSYEREKREIIPVLL